MSILTWQLTLAHTRMSLRMRLLITLCNWLLLGDAAQIAADMAHSHFTMTILESRSENCSARATRIGQYIYAARPMDLPSNGSGPPPTRPTGKQRLDEQEQALARTDYWDDPHAPQADQPDAVGQRGRAHKSAVAARRAHLTVNVPAMPFWA